MKLFSKTNISEYNDEIEDILETKKINSETKSLILSMIYKIENSYDDYSKVKSKIETQDEYIKKIIRIIRDECEEIIAVTPKTKESKKLEDSNEICIIDAKAGRILVYANEKFLLYSIFRLDIEINQNKYYSQYENMHKTIEQTYEIDALKKFLAIGFSMDESEVIRDFNGWSWDTNVKEIDDITINLIYQNITLLLGEKIKKSMLLPYTIIKEENNLNANVENLREENDIDVSKENEEKITDCINIINKAFNKLYLNYKVKDIIRNINIIILSIEAEKNKKVKNEINNMIENKKNMSELMENKSKFLDKIMAEKKIINNRIKEIDTLLNDKEKLFKEYEKRNSKLKDNYKIFSISHLDKILTKERENLINQLRTKNKLLEPKTYILEKQKLEEKINFYTDVINTIDKNKRKEILINIQKEFISCFIIQIEQAGTKKELLNLLYKFRYYCLLPINELQEVKDIKILEEDIKKVINLLIDKSIDQNLIENISNSVSLCYNTLKYIFFTRIIDLENIYIKIIKNEQENVEGSKEKKYYITINLYDIKEEEENYEEIVNNLLLLNIKLNKRLKLFL